MGLIAERRVLAVQKGAGRVQKILSLRSRRQISGGRKRRQFAALRGPLHAGLESICASEGLPKAEKEIDVRPLAEIGTRCPTGNRVCRCSRNRVVDIHWIDGWIQVVAEIKSYGTDGRV